MGDVADALARLGLGDEREGGNGAAAPVLPSPPAVVPLAAMEPVLAALTELIAWPTTHAALGAALGVRWPRGLLLHGPPGTGKTAAVLAVAAATGAPVVTLAPGSVFGAHLGESEARVRAAFRAAARAARTAPSGARAVLLLDDVDALAPCRASSGPHEARVVGQLLTLLDGAASGGGGGPGTAPPFAVVATTSRPGALDPALRRAGRLDREVAVGLPTAGERGAILAAHCAGLPLAPDVDLPAIAASSRGYSGADLASLARTAARRALAAAAAGAAAAPPPPVSAADFAAAAADVGASVVRGLATDAGPPTTWDDVGGLEGVKAALKRLVETPLARPAACARLGYTPPRGILLHGPPGTAKTTLARAVAAAARASLHPLPAAALFSAFVGEGEAALRAAFAAARAAAPAVVFLDEADAVGADRGGGGGGAGDPSSPAGARMLTTLLTELDGLEPADGVLLLAATNAPWALDGALLRPGRLDARVLVPPPDEAGLAAALTLHARGKPLHAGVDVGAVAAAMAGGTGADAAAVVREAALAAARRGGASIAAPDFDAALAGWRPSVARADLAAHEAWAAAASGRAG